MKNFSYNLKLLKSSLTPCSLKSIKGVHTTGKLENNIIFSHPTDWKNWKTKIDILNLFLLGRAPTIIVTIHASIRHGVVPL